MCRRFPLRRSHGTRRYGLSGSSFTPALRSFGQRCGDGATVFRAALLSRRLCLLWELGLAGPLAEHLPHKTAELLEGIGATAGATPGPKGANPEDRFRAPGQHVPGTQRALVGL